MRFNPSFRLAILALGLFSLVWAGCDDDPVTPKVSPWAAVALPDSLEGTSLFGIAFHGDHGLIAGLRYSAGTSNPATVVLETTGADWARIHPPGIGETVILDAVAFTPAGEAILGGVDLTGSGAVLLDQRNGWNPVKPGVTGAVVAIGGGNGVLRAVGVSVQGLALVSTAADTWTAEGAGFVTVQANDKALVDLAWEDGVFTACGYDDAADGSPQEPARVVVQNDGSGWAPIPSPFVSATWELKAVAVAGNGAILVAGARTDFSAGAADDYVAMLMIRDPGSGDWFPIDLPRAGSLDRVNDILITSGGDVVLACGLDTVHLLSGPVSGGFTDEGPGTAGTVWVLAEGPGGAIYAAGTMAADPEHPETAMPLLLRREAD